MTRRPARVWSPCASAPTRFRDGDDAVIGIVGFILLLALLVLVVESVRWMCRPAARRLRAIRKIGGRR